jgi:hypothetical protein
MTDLTEEEMPVSGGGSSCTWKRSGELMFALLEEKQEVHFEAEKLALAEETATSCNKRALGDNERALELQNTYMEYLEWADAEKTKRIEVLEKKYREKEYEEAQQEVDENQKGHLTCLGHYLG